MFSDDELREIRDTGRNGKISTEELMCALMAEQLIMLRRQTPLRKLVEAPIPPSPERVSLQESANKLKK
jgi:hypothetical protein